MQDMKAKNKFLAMSNQTQHDHKNILTKLEQFLVILHSVILFSSFSSSWLGRVELDKGNVTYFHVTVTVWQHLNYKFMIVVGWLLILPARCHSNVIKPQCQTNCRPVNRPVDCFSLLVAQPGPGGIVQVENKLKQMYEMQTLLHPHSQIYSRPTNVCVFFSARRKIVSCAIFFFRLFPETPGLTSLWHTDFNRRNGEEKLKP